MVAVLAVVAKAAWGEASVVVQEVGRVGVMVKEGGKETLGAQRVSRVGEKHPRGKRSRADGRWGRKLA